MTVGIDYFKFSLSKMEVKLAFILPGIIQSLKGSSFFRKSVDRLDCIVHLWQWPCSGSLLWHLLRWLRLLQWSGHELVETSSNWKCDWQYGKLLDVASIEQEHLRQGLLRSQHHHRSAAAVPRRLRHDQVCHVASGEDLGTGKVAWRRQLGAMAVLCADSKRLSRQVRRLHVSPADRFDANLHAGVHGLCPSEKWRGDCVVDQWSTINDWSVRVVCLIKGAPRVCPRSIRAHSSTGSEHAFVALDVATTGRHCKATVFLLNQEDRSRWSLRLQWPCEPMPSITWRVQMWLSA